MTTIVYDHKNKLIACDSRVTLGNFIATDESIKHKKHNDEMWFFSGNRGEQDLFIESFSFLCLAPENLSVTALCVKDKKVYLRNIDNHRVFRECLLDFTDGCGSGCEHAINALELGLDIKSAVEYAAKKDNCSGGTVHVYDIEKEKFI